MLLLRTIALAGAVIAMPLFAQAQSEAEVRASELLGHVSDLRHASGRLLLDASQPRLELKPGFEGRRWPDPEYRIERYERASALLGRAAEDPLGNAVGALRDVAIDLETGRTLYVLVEFADEDSAVLPLAPHLVRLRPGENPVVTGRAHRRS